MMKKMFESMGQKPDFNSIILGEEFQALPTKIQADLAVKYGFEEFFGDAVTAAVSEPAQHQKSSATESRVSAPRQDVTVDSVEPKSGGRQERKENEPFKIPDLEERLSRLQQRGYVLTSANIADRVARGHGRIFVGYGAERGRDLEDGRFFLREAFAKKLGREVAARVGEDYDTSAVNTDIVLPENIRERWNSDAAFRNEVLRLVTDMRDEMEEKVYLMFDNLPKEIESADAQEFRANRATLAPKWKYRQDGKWQYRPFDATTIPDKAFDTLLANPRNYHKLHEWKSWFGRPLQAIREQVISERLTERYGDQAAQESSLIEAQSGKTAPEMVDAKPIKKEVVADEDEKSEPTHSEPPESKAVPKFETVAAKAETKPWSAAEIGEIAVYRVAELGRLFENAPDVPKFVEYAFAVVKAQLAERGRKSVPPRSLVNKVKIANALSAAFSSYYHGRSEAASVEEARDILVGELVDGIWTEAFGENHDDAEPKEEDLRRRIAEALVERHLVLSPDDSFEYKAVDTIKEDAARLRSKMGG